MVIGAVEWRLGTATIVMLIWIRIAVLGIQAAVVVNHGIVSLVPLVIAVVVNHGIVSLVPLVIAVVMIILFVIVVMHGVVVTVIMVIMIIILVIAVGMSYAGILLVIGGLDVIGGRLVPVRPVPLVALPVMISVNVSHAAVVIIN